jgi:UDP-glucose 4-epimerase
VFLSNLVPFITQTGFGLRKSFRFGRLSTPDGTAVRDYIHVVDLAKALLFIFTLLNKKKKK